MRISCAVWVVSALFGPHLIAACPDARALQFFEHRIAFDRALGGDPFKGLSLIHMDVWVHGPITGLYVREELKEFHNPSLRMTYLFGEEGSQGGGTCRVGKDWRQCIEQFAPAENTSDPIITCQTTVDLHAIPAWIPSPNDQRKKQIGRELRSEIEALYQDAEEIVVRDFNLMDNDITIYVKTSDGEYFQGCDFHANIEPHCGWHLFGQAPLSRIRKSIFARPYRLK